jgi:hypothetical protein
MVLLVPLFVWFIDHVEFSSQSGDILVGVALLGFGLAAWSICGLWWMHARAEIVDVVVEKRDQQLKARRRRRRGRDEGS